MYLFFFLVFYWSAFCVSSWRPRWRRRTSRYYHYFYRENFYIRRYALYVTLEPCFFVLFKMTRDNRKCKKKQKKNAKKTVKRNEQIKLRKRKNNTIFFLFILSLIRLKYFYVPNLFYFYCQINFFWFNVNFLLLLFLSCFVLYLFFLSSKVYLLRILVSFCSWLL